MSRSTGDYFRRNRTVILIVLDLLSVTITVHWCPCRPVASICQQSIKRNEQGGNYSVGVSDANCTGRPGPSPNSVPALALSSGFSSRIQYSGTAAL